MTSVRISRLHFPVTTLGPGRRLGIWFQGCSIRCPGCLSIDTWAGTGGETTVEIVLDAVSSWLEEADGVTISGGEPLEQPEALEALLRGVRERTATDVLLFTGRSYETAAEWLEARPGLVDAIVSDPYDESVPQTLALRGSDNQRLHMLTSLGRARFGPFERPADATDRRLDVMFDPDGTVWLAGIPARGDLERFRAFLEAAGHRVVLSTARSGGTEA